ncbi:D-alanyl-D-alanine carboxypeptidase family protein [Uliginosibacterium sp. sgz301328]|uniref:D-alanyl-D-alanine carboxypeptidase family protein n=1 Tax=Uliginosibacterium sp. sgz301328 TaxID=3243764 RepID=UPI00359D9557
MKRFLIACALALCTGVVYADPPRPPTVPAKSWVLFDLAGNQQLASQGADTRIDPGAMAQLMTVYVALTEVRAGDLSLDKEITPSKAALQAAKGGGASLYLAENQPVKVTTLLDGVAVLGANDAAVALAEATSGNEAGFVELMNAEARRLGMTGTVFKNASGISVTGQYSTVRDIAILSTALVRVFPQDYARFAQKTFSYRNIVQQNRNRLLWLDPSADGLADADVRVGGNQLAASAVRGPRRLVVVVSGAQSRSQASQSAQQLLNFGFQRYDAIKLYAANTPVRTLTVWKGASREVRAGFLRDLVVAVPRDEADSLKLQFVGREPMIAPLAVGDRVGSLRVTLEGRTLAEYPVVALDAVPPAGWLGRAWDQLRIWLK